MLSSKLGVATDMSKDGSSLDSNGRNKKEGRAGKKRERVMVKNCLRLREKKKQQRRNDKNKSVVTDVRGREGRERGCLFPNSTRL
jgi:hypothetical protein